MGTHQLCQHLRKPIRKAQTRPVRALAAADQKFGFLHGAWVRFVEAGAVASRFGLGAMRLADRPNLERRQWGIRLAFLALDSRRILFGGEVPGHQSLSPDAPR
jgi:hypothetical protein